jgi:uracil phosphoribosyltransferase
MPAEVHVIKHPLVQHKLTLMRQKQLSTSSFRNLMSEISMLLAYEVTRDLPVVVTEVETPMAKTQGALLEGKKIVLIPILRAGTGIVDGMLRILPSARVGHIGVYRDPETLGAVEYYAKMPGEMRDRDVIVANPLLATGNSAIAAVDRVKSAQPKSIKFVCLVAAPEGVANFHDSHPDVPIYTAAVDDRIDDQGYIIPGLGDAGDRLFGTK